MSDALPNTPEAAVIPFTARMSDAAYDAERARLRETYGDTRAEAGAKFEQALAALFHRSGWTQEELAKKEDKSQRWIAYRLCFGRFLNFSTMVLKSESLPNNLTERRFRSYWERTEGDERHRFREITKLMKTEVAVMAPRRPKIGEALKERYADGKWHSLDVMVGKFDFNKEHVRETLDGVCKNQTYGMKAEKKKVGTEFHYRMFKMEKMISSHELIEKLAPLVKALEEQGRKNQVTMSVAAVAVLASQLRRLLHDWAE